MPIASGLFQTSTGYANVPHCRTRTIETDDYIDWRSTETFGTPLGGGGGITDHGNLSGLSDDDHLQYHDDIRGDARYYQQSEVDAFLAAQNEASEITIDNIAGTPVLSVQEESDHFHSAGHISGGEITWTVGPDITILAGTGYIRQSEDPTSTLYSVNWPETELTSLLTNTRYWVGVEVVVGVPTVQLYTSEPSHQTVVNLGVAFYGGVEMHYDSSAGYYVGDHPHKIISRLKETERYTRVTGAVISGTNLNLAITAGSFWEGLSQFETTALNTAISDDYDFFYRNGSGGWILNSALTEVDPNVYDDGDGIPAPISVGNYSVNWVYIGTESHLIVVCLSVGLYKHIIPQLR